MSAHLDTMLTFAAAFVVLVISYRRCPRRSGFVLCAAAVADVLTESWEVRGERCEL